MVIGFEKAQEEPGVYIGMQGASQEHEKLINNRATGKFEIV